jgi:hypothetical protein
MQHENDDVPFCLFIVAMQGYYSQPFSGSFDLVATQQYQNGNERSDTISYYLGEKMTAIIIHGRRNQPDIRMVFNFPDATITSLFELNDKKGGYILPMNEAYWPGMPQAIREFGTGPRTEQNYTGEIKDIENHSCHEVLAESDDYSATLWVAEDIPLSMTHVLAYQSVGKGKSKKEIELFDQFGVEGLPLLLFLKSKTEKANVAIQLINFSDDIDATVFSTEGHTLSTVD